MSKDRTLTITAWAEGDLIERSLGREVVDDPTEAQVRDAIARLFARTQAPRVRVEYQSAGGVGPALTVNLDDGGVASRMIRDWAALPRGR